MPPISINRYLANSHKSIIALILKGMEKIATPPAGGMPLSVRTQDGCTIQGAAFIALKNTANAKMSVRQAKNEILAPSRVTIKKAINCFVKLLHIQIELGLLSNSCLVGYGLVDEKQPDIDTDLKIKAVGLAIKTGEANRIAAGGTPMPILTLGMFTSRLADFNTKELAFSNAKTESNTAAADVRAAFPFMKTWGLNYYNEVEGYYDMGNAENMRSNSKDWGLKYYSEGEKTLVTIKLLEKTTELPLAGIVKCLKTGKEYNVDMSGSIVIETLVKNVVAYEGEALDHSTEEVEVSIVEGMPLTVDIHLELLP